MKILYVVSRPLQINTSASVRNRATILGLLENGHEIHVFTTEPDVNHPAYDSSLVPQGITATYVRLNGAQTFARFSRKISFLKSIRRFIYKLMSKSEIYDNLKGIIYHIDKVDLSNSYDVIISSSDPKSSHLFVKKLLDSNRKVFNGRWIQIWGDPFLGDITLGKNKQIKKIKKEESDLIAAADKVIYVSALTLEEQKKLYPISSDKMTYCPIPYSEKIIYSLRDLKTISPLELIYCGDYNSSVRNLLPLYKAVNSMDNVHLTICGNSDKPLKSTDKVTVFGRVSYSKVKELEEKADILIHLSNLSGSQIPGKIYQYSGTNKPIMFILDGNEDLLLKQFKQYDRFEFARNELQSISNSIKKIIQDNILKKPLDDFSKSIIANQILK